MGKKAIPDDVKREVAEIVDTYNLEVLRDPDYFFKARFQGRYVYLDRYDHGRGGPICRLGYKGAMDAWDFAIYKYSSDRYDPNEWFFPGSELVDGTVEGALRAGTEAYPKSPAPRLFRALGSILDFVLGGRGGK